MRKVFLKHPIHLSEMRHVVEEHVDFDDTVEPHAGFREDALDVLAALGGFVRDAAFDQGAFGVGGDLAGYEDLRTRDDGLGLSRVLAELLYRCNARVGVGGAGWDGVWYHRIGPAGEMQCVQCVL